MVVAVGDEGRQRVHVMWGLNNRNFIRLKDREKKTRHSCQGDREPNLLLFTVFNTCQVFSTQQTI